LGFKPYCVVNTNMLTAIKNAGGIASGDSVRFDPRLIMEKEDISPALRELMERMIDDFED
jgi:hypothetical protein